MKGILCALILLLAWVSRASPIEHRPPHSNNIIVIIQPALAGPEVDPNTYWSPLWVLWPRSIGGGKGGSLLSVATGAVWVGDATDFWTANLNDIKRHGFFQMRTRMIGPIRTDLLLNSKGGASVNALVLSLNSDSAKMNPFWASEAWPPDSLMVAEASSWDDVRMFESVTSGRVLVFEYPPRVDVSWTRFWLRGHGWPADGKGRSGKGPSRGRVSGEKLGVVNAATAPRSSDSAVPGLIGSRHLILLVMHPEEFYWDSVDNRSWPGANRLLELNHVTGPWFAFGWMLFTLGGIVWGATLVAHERSSRVVPYLLTTILLSPAIVDGAGFMGRQLGVTSWPVWLLLSTLVALGCFYSLGGLQRRFLPKAHPLLSGFFLGFVILFLIDPVWSFMSPVLGGRVWPVSPVALASLFGYLTGMVACIQGCGKPWIWAARAVCIVMVLAGFMTRVWLSADIGAASILPVMAWLIGERRFRWPMLIIALLWPTSLAPLLFNGNHWHPVGLLVSGFDVNRLNAYDYVDFITCASLQVFVPVAGGIALFGFRFFFHQIKGVMQLDLRRSALPTSALVAAAAGVLHPVFLYAALTLATGAASVLLLDAVQTM